MGCARCLRRQFTLIRVSSQVFGLFIGRGLCAFCVSDVLRQVVDRMGL